MRNVYENWAVDGRHLKGGAHLPEFYASRINP